MNTFQAIRQQAREKRDKAIQAARLEYRVTLREIKRLHCRLNGATPTKPRKSISAHLMPRPKDQDYHDWTAIKAAETVLRELGPLTLVEVVAAIQSHGCRSQDDPRLVMNSVRESFRYHSDKFQCDADKRWSVC